MCGTWLSAGGSGLDQLLPAVLFGPGKAPGIAGPQGPVLVQRLLLQGIGGVGLGLGKQTGAGYRGVVGQVGADGEALGEAYGPLDLLFLLDRKSVV